MSWPADTQIDALYAVIYRACRFEAGETSVNLRRKNLTQEDVKCLVRQMEGGATPVTSLDLSQNSLGAPWATSWFGVGSGIEALADSLQANRLRLHTLKLRWCELGTAEVERLAEALSANQSLQSIDLRNNHIGDRGAKVMADVLRADGTTLTFLDLSGCGITAEGAHAIAEALLYEDTPLRELNLSFNPLCDVHTDGTGTYNAKGIRALADVLRANKLTSLGLESIELCGVIIRSTGTFGTFTAEGIEAITDALRGNWSLISLDLSWNLLGYVVMTPFGAHSAPGIAAVTAALKINRTLTSLDLSLNAVDMDSIEALVDAVRDNASLASLNLHRNEIGDVGAKALGQLLHDDKSLKSLDVSENDIGPEGAKAFARGLENNRSLTALTVSTDIQDEGIQAIADALCHNYSLTSLSLMKHHLYSFVTLPIRQLNGTDPVESLTLTTSGVGGMLTDWSAIIIASLLEVNDSLKQLRLVDHAIGDEGAKAIADALRVNRSLTSIDLSDNVIEDDGVRAIIESLNDNETLTSLDLSANDKSRFRNNRIRDETKAELQAMVGKRDGFNLMLPENALPSPM